MQMSATINVFTVTLKVDFVAQVLQNLVNPLNLRSFNKVGARLLVRSSLGGPSFN